MKMRIRTRSLICFPAVGSSLSRKPFRRTFCSRSAQQKSIQTERTKTMKTCIHHTKIVPAFLIALALSCLVFSAVAQTGNPSIVGLWRVHYFENGAQVFQSFDQWHSDGQEFEISNIFGLSCQGVFRQLANGSVKHFHVGWTFDQNGSLTGYFRETQINTVSPLAATAKPTRARGI